MDVDEPSGMQILLAWRDHSWVVLHNGVEVGAYADRSQAIGKARALHAEAKAAGMACYMLVRELDGHWEEHPCPGPGREAGA